MEVSDYIKLTVAVLSGSAISKVWEHFFISKKDEDQALLMLIQQLQANVNENNDKVKELQAEVKEWRDKYYIAFEEKHNLSIELRDLQRQFTKLNANMANN